MENVNKLNDQEIDDLKKSLTTLGLPQEEIDSYIEKAIKEKEGAAEPTIEEKADVSGEENKEGAEKKEKEEKPIEKSTLGEDDLEKCNMLKAEKAKIEKSISELEEKMGKGKKLEVPDEDLKKSITTDIEKSFGERIIDIEKSLTDRFSGEIEDLKTIVKSIGDDVKKIGDTSLGTKSVFHKANFFEKGVEDDLSTEDSKELSITRDRDDILKGMQDMLDKEKDTDVRQMLSDGISDYTVNTVPTSHGIRALAYLSRKKNITLGQ